jgi:oligoendopeptidase F
VTLFHLLTKKCILFLPYLALLSSRGLSFYNWPYTHGYAFALAVYAKSDMESFSKMYVNLLRDTGRMTSEECVGQHMGDISTKAFWDDAIGIMTKQVDQFEVYASELGYKLPGK